MPNHELLPGVTADACPPRVVCDAHAAIASARRRALFRGAVQVSLLLAIDYLFVYWPDSRIPLLDRRQSMLVLYGVNILAVADLLLIRALPKWRSRRIAETWSRRERDRVRL